MKSKSLMDSNFLMNHMTSTFTCTRIFSQTGGLGSGCKPEGLQKATSVEGNNTDCPHLWKATPLITGLKQVKCSAAAAVLLPSWDEVSSLQLTALSTENLHTVNSGVFEQIKLKQVGHWLESVKLCSGTSQAAWTMQFKPLFMW